MATLNINIDSASSGCIPRLKVRGGSSQIHDQVRLQFRGCQSLPLWLKGIKFGISVQPPSLESSMFTSLIVHKYISFYKCLFLRSYFRFFWVVERIFNKYISFFKLRISVATLLYSCCCAVLWRFALPRFAQTPPHPLVVVVVIV